MIRQQRSKFALWDYCDLRSSLKEAPRPASWSSLVQLRMRRWGDLLDASKDKRFTIEKDKCVMLEMLQTLNCRIRKCGGRGGVLMIRIEELFTWTTIPGHH